MVFEPSQLICCNKCCRRGSLIITDLFEIRENDVALFTWGCLYGVISQMFTPRCLGLVKANEPLFLLMFISYL